MGPGIPRDTSRSRLDVTLKAQAPGTQIQERTTISGIGLANPEEPTLSAAGALNAASFTSAGAASGPMMSLFGTEFTDQAARAPSPLLPEELPGTSLRIGEQVRLDGP